MIIMLIIVGVIFGGIFGFKGFQSYMMKKYMSSAAAPAVTVSVVTAVTDEWQPQISAVGSLRAARGVDIASEVAGIVQNVNCKSGDNVTAGQTLLQLNADSDIAQLQTLSAARDLSQSVYERNKKQFIAQAVSKASLDADAADLESQTGAGGSTGSSCKKKDHQRAFCRTAGYLFGESRTVSESGR
ncbi:MAG: biotin/lipoyl-binding protein [Marinilabiliales bacterium]|nr:biotin/lipoyl-binding protein [Marinilabiliales bacterium]